MTVTAFELGKRNGNVVNMVTKASADTISFFGLKVQGIREWYFVNINNVLGELGIIVYMAIVT
jgi:hypothetical protein